MSKTKSAHYSKIIAKHSGDHGSVWTAPDTVALKCTLILDDSSVAALVNTLFLNKSSFIPSFSPSDSYSCVLNPSDSRKVLQNLADVTSEEVCRLILQAPCKSSDLDPILTSLLKNCVDICVTPITSTIYLSFTEGYFPSHFKSALVSPILKKPSLDKDSMKNYRPVSNLSFLSKGLEKVVVNQLNSHINTNKETSNQY